MLVHVCTHSQGEEKNGWQNVLLPWKKGIRPTYCIHQCSDCDHFPCRRTCPSSLRRARSLDLRDLNCSVLKTSSLVPKAHSTSPEGESCRVCWVSLFVQVVETFICKRPVTLCIILLGLILICCVRDCTSLLPPLSWGKGSLNFGSSMNLWFTLIAMVYLLNIMYTSLHTA